MSIKRSVYVLVAFALLSIVALAGWKALPAQKSRGSLPSQMSAQALSHFEIIEQHGEALLGMPGAWDRLELIEQHGEALQEVANPWSRFEIIERHGEALQGVTP